MPAADTLIMVLVPHLEERAGLRFHTERFDGYVEGELIVTSRQPRHDGARRLLDLGHDPDTRMHVQHQGQPVDPTLVPRPLGELAQWTYEESDRDGIRKVRWRPPEERTGVARRTGWPSPAAADLSGGNGVSFGAAAA